MSDERVPEPAEALAAPQAERLLQPVRDQDAPDRRPQQQQTQVLGAAPVGARASRLDRVVVDLGGPAPPRHVGLSCRVDVGQRLGLREQAQP